MEDLMLARRCLLAFPLAIAIAPIALGQDRSIVVASTTSTEDSGLFDHILPLFKAKTGIDVKVVAQGTPGVKGSKDIVAAFKTIKEKKAPFISRGDRSGTNIAELNLWKLAGIDIAAEKGPWYKDIGQGMGAALNSASASNAYVLSDRGTWLSFKNKGDLVIAVEGDKRLFNQYGVMLVNPQKHPNVKKELGQQFIDWLISPEGQKAIADYKINGEQLFYPNANDPNA
jgi:tungstate transport system substrate-binding protein